MKEALIVVDMQYDFLPGGALAIAGGDEILSDIADLMPCFDTVICTQDWHTSGHLSFASTHDQPPFSSKLLHGQEHILWPDHCIQDSLGAALHPEMRQPWVSLILRKGANTLIDSYSAFHENFGPDGLRKSTGLQGFLSGRGITHVHVCGLARDYCVKWTALDAAPDFDTTVHWDLTRAVDPKSDAATRAELLDAEVRIV
jgi:nicotinamidase/pyrazinamidase